MSEVVRAKNPKLGNVVALKLPRPSSRRTTSFASDSCGSRGSPPRSTTPTCFRFTTQERPTASPTSRCASSTGRTSASCSSAACFPLSHAVSIVGQVGRRAGRRPRARPDPSRREAGQHLDRSLHPDAAPHVYLADFGVAKHTLSRSGLTTTGEFVGTIDYVAPEQIEGKTIDARTDVYSLGCVFYECLTGKKPFDRDSNVAVMYAHLMEPPPAPSEEREGLPAEVDAVVAKALAKAPEERYATCGELLLLLARLWLETTSAGAAAPSAAALSSTIDFLDIDSGTGIVARPLPPPSAATEPVSTNGDAKTRRLRPAASLDKRYVLVAAVVLLALAGAGLAATQLLGSSSAVATPPPKTASTIATHREEDVQTCAAGADRGSISRRREPGPRYPAPEGARATGPCGPRALDRHERARDQPGAAAGKAA